MGRLALSHEIDRARRSDGRFVLAFIDVDRLKAVNDRDGHAAGDRVLQTVVREIRTRLRSFDPIVRYGGDEFVCGLGGTDIAEAKRRFEAIGRAIEADVSVGISVGLAALAPDDTAERLTERADAAMLEIKARHHDVPVATARRRRSARTAGVRPCSGSRRRRPAPRPALSRGRGRVLDDERGDHAVHAVGALGVRKDVAVERPRAGLVAVDRRRPSARPG